MVFFCSDISVVLFHTVRFSRCHNTFLACPRLSLIIVVVPYVDPLVCRIPSCEPNVLNYCTAEAKGDNLDPVRLVMPPVFYYLPFQVGGSLMLHVGMSLCI